MKLLKFYTTPVDPRQSFAVRRWGVLGARRFWLAWGGFMYGFLALSSGYLISNIGRQSDEFTGAHIPYLAAALIVVTASMLTRMLLQVVTELRRLEPPEQKDGDAS
jgi:hypothetical protein